MSKILYQVRKLIETSGQTRYAIAKATGISETQLSLLMAGKKGLSLDSMELLTEHLGHEVVLRKKRKGK